MNLIFFFCYFDAIFCYFDAVFCYFDAEPGFVLLQLAGGNLYPLSRMGIPPPFRSPSARLPASARDARCSAPTSSQGGRYGGRQSPLSTSPQRTRMGMKADVTTVVAPRGAQTWTLNNTSSSRLPPKGAV